MRSPQTVLETLRKHAQKAHYQYERLYRNLYNPQLYLLAYQNLYANKGSTTAGADGATLSGMSLKRIESLIKTPPGGSTSPRKVETGCARWVSRRQTTNWYKKPFA